MFSTSSHFVRFNNFDSWHFCNVPISGFSHFRILACSAFLNFRCFFAFVALLHFCLFTFPHFRIFAFTHFCFFAFPHFRGFSVFVMVALLAFYKIPGVFTLPRTPSLLLNGPWKRSVKKSPLQTARCVVSAPVCKSSFFALQYERLFNKKKGNTCFPHSRILWGLPF